MLRSARIATKLLAVFAAIGALLALVLVVVLVMGSQTSGRIEAISELHLPNVMLVGELMEQVAAVGRSQYGYLNDRLPADFRAEQFQLQRDEFQKMEKLSADLDVRLKGEREVAWRKTKAMLGQWRDASERLEREVRQRDAAGAPGSDGWTAAQALALRELQSAREARRRLTPELDELSKLVEAEAEREAAGGNAALRAMEWGLALTVIVSLAIAFGGLAFLRKEIEGFVGFFDRHLGRVAAGELPEKLTESRGADFNALRDALNGVTGTLRGIIAEMNRMSAEHAKGDIDVVVDVARFQGAYAAMARGVNEMVGAHIEVKKKAMAIFGEFGRGNFDAQLEQLPGKKRFINDTIEQVRANLKGLIAEMNRMSSEHEKGDIDAVIDTGKFQGNFRTMAEGVNGMVGAHISVKKQAMAVFSEFGRGNFEAPMPLLPGKKRFINDTIEQVRGNLRALVADTAALSKAAVEGRLEVRADASKQPGDFGRIIQGINDTLDALVAPIRDLSATLDKLAAGDLAARADLARYQNEARAILQGVNGTLDALLAPVNEATAVLGKLADRDLQVRMTGDYQGGHAKMKEAVNGTAQSLHQAIAQVADAVRQVTSASQQIASSSQAVASGASEQASSLEETTASVESVASIAKQSSESAQQATTLAQDARGAATGGATAVEQMQGAMGKIKASAESTSQIIKDINEIAFQTNLLALNAAVEAARAGEAGRGFAVVAEEVRSLALRAKEAATKTEELIRQSVKEANEGEGMAKEVATQLDRIVKGAGKVTDLIAEIAAAAREQASGIEQVNKAIAEMDKVTQQNAASAEESSSAASELNGQAEELAAMVETFRLERSAAAGPRRAPALAAAPTPAPAPAPGKNGHSRKRLAASKDPFPMEDGDAGVRDF